MFTVDSKAKTAHNLMTVHTFQITGTDMLLVIDLFSHFLDDSPNFFVYLAPER